MSQSFVRQRQRRQALAGYLFAAPVILGFLIWVLGPVVATFALSLSDWDIMGKAHWVGLRNFVEIFARDPFFYDSLKATFIFGIGSVLARMVYSFAVALLLSHAIPGKGVLRTIFYMPSIVPIVAASVVWVWCFQPDFGLFNSVLKSLGLPGSRWLYSTETVLPSLILVDLWCSSNTIIIFLAGLQGVPQELRDAVAIDGGGAIRRLTAVTIPHMTPFIFFNMILGFINNFQSFTLAFVMTRVGTNTSSVGGPNNASLMSMVLIYREAFQNSRMGYACALSVVLLAITGAITLVLFKTGKSWVFYAGEGK